MKFHSACEKGLWYATASLVNGAGLGSRASVGVSENFNGPGASFMALPDIYPLLAERAFRDGRKQEPFRVSIHVPEIESNLTGTANESKSD